MYDISNIQINDNPQEDYKGFLFVWPAYAIQEVNELAKAISLEEARELVSKKLQKERQLCIH